MEEREEIQLVDEEGHEHTFFLVDVLELEDEKKYAILMPAEEEGEEDETALILRWEKDEEGQDILVEIDDDEEFNRVVEALNALAEKDESEE